MPARPSYRGKLLSCVLALLAAFQPVAAMDCACACNCRSISDDATCAAEHDHDHCCGKDCGDACGHQHCRENQCSEGAMQEPNGAVDWATTLGLCPCQCPRECDCHLRHSIVIALARKTDHSVQREHGSMAIAERPTLPVLRPSSVVSGPAANLSALSDTSALSLCAELCRFLS
jgi:hypothetical protein